MATYQRFSKLTIVKIKISTSITVYNKNAFQWNDNCPLADRCIGYIANILLQVWGQGQGKGGP